MKNLRKFKNIFRGEKGQGATEYILLVAVIVGGLVIFGPRLKTLMTDQIDKVEKGAADLK